MREIWAPEIIIALFYLLFLLRAPVRRLRSLDGLVWLPPVALALNLGIFPAYGFRPELLPLLVYGIVLNARNLPALGAGFRRDRDTELFLWGPLFTVLNLGLLGGVFSLALVFSPLRDTALDPGAKTFTIRDEGRGREYFLRAYGAGEGTRPLLLLAPPPAGSAPVVDRLCGDLERRGFTVLAFSRRGFDTPAVGDGGRIYPASPLEYLRRIRLLSSATRLKKVNDTGRALETGRREDLEFLLGWIRENRGAAIFGEPAASRPLFLAGYGAGGSALIFLAAAPGFARRNPAVRGIIAVESLLWSAYREEEPPPPPPPGDSGPLGRVLGAGAALGRRFAGLGPKKMAGHDPAPPPELPLLVLLSGRAREPKYRDGPYRAILSLIPRLREPGLLAAAQGAGPLDYTDCSVRYPLLSALYPAGGGAPGGERWNGGDFTGGAAALITAFAALVLEAGEGGAGAGLSPAGVPSPGLYLEKRAWNLPDLRLY